MHIVIAIFIVAIFAVSMAISKRKFSKRVSKKRYIRKIEVSTIFSPSGAPAGTTKFCPSCGREIPKNKDYSSFCDEKI